jgi:hypothetical protein
MSDETYVANAPAAMSTNAAVPWHQSDYAWTQSPEVEAFFTVLTIVIVPVALIRWARRLDVFAARRRGDAHS